MWNAQLHQHLESIQKLAIVEKDEVSRSESELAPKPTWMMKLYRQSILEEIKLTTWNGWKSNSILLFIAMVGCIRLLTFYTNATTAAVTAFSLGYLFAKVRNRQFQQKIRNENLLDIARLLGSIGSPIDFIKTSDTEYQDDHHYSLVLLKNWVQANVNLLANVNEAIRFVQTCTSVVWKLPLNTIPRMENKTRAIPAPRLRRLIFETLCRQDFLIATLLEDRDLAQEEKTQSQPNVLTIKMLRVMRNDVLELLADAVRYLLSRRRDSDGTKILHLTSQVQQLSSYIRSIVFSFESTTQPYLKLGPVSSLLSRVESLHANLLVATYDEIATVDCWETISSSLFHLNTSCEQLRNELFPSSDETSRQEPCDDHVGDSAFEWETEGTGLTEYSTENEFIDEKPQRTQIAPMDKVLVFSGKGYLESFEMQKGVTPRKASQRSVSSPPNIDHHSEQQLIIELQRYLSHLPRYDEVDVSKDDDVGGRNDEQIDQFVTSAIDDSRSDIVHDCVRKSIFSELQVALSSVARDSDMNTIE